jgi:hypothetical protein
MCDHFAQYSDLISPGVPDDFAYHFGIRLTMDALVPFTPSKRPDWVLCHEHHRSKRRCGTVREMKEGPSGSAIRSLIPSHRKLLWSKVTVVSVAETPGR